MQQCGVDIVRKNHMPGNENSRNATDLIADVARGLPGVTEVLAYGTAVVIEPIAPQAPANPAQ